MKEQFDYKAVLTELKLNVSDLPELIQNHISKIDSLADFISKEENEELKDSYLEQIEDLNEKVVEMICDFQYEHEKTTLEKSGIDSPEELQTVVEKKLEIKIGGILRFWELFD